ncbi:pseudouridine synthase [Rufibacter sp. LB8]|uniref:pseudouridine synthase n=1 Tax=Rufibacter sp. LB8 TaxID=2777781 RepID=UPI00178C28A8|nr:pseudouridine synthase [Rufibacter sp. LB8]
MARNEDTPQEGNERPRENRGGDKKVFGRGTRFDRPEGGNREGSRGPRDRNTDRPSFGDRPRAPRPDDTDGSVNSRREDRERAPKRENDRRPGDFRPARGFERPDRGNNDRPAFGDRPPRRDGDRPDNRRSSSDREGGYNRPDRDSRDSRGSGSFQDRREGSRGPARDGGDRGERRSFGGDRDSRGGDRRGSDRPAFGAGRDDRRDNRDGDRREGGFSNDRPDRGSFNRDDRRERPAGDREERGSFNRGSERPEGRAFQRSEDRPDRAPRDFGSDSRNEAENGNDRPPHKAGDKPFDRSAPRENRDDRPAFDRSAPRENRGDRPFDRNAPRENRGGDRPSFQSRDNKFDRGSRPERNDRGADRGAGRGRDDRSRPSDEETKEAPFYNLKRYEERRKQRDETYNAQDFRLNRYIANAGICSRREADELIAAGEIKVNGEVVTEMGYRVGPNDTVTYGRKKLNREKTVYVLLNKPKDFITTTEDPEGRKTVMDLIKNASKERMFPVGRLDRNTTGLLLFTNDGELAQKLTHPSNKISKIYQVELDKPITQDDVKKIQEGLMLEDGKAEVDEVALLGDSNKFLGVEIHIGRNRIVRRIFEHLGYDVVTLDRVQYAGLTKKDLPRGNWRFLSEKEVVRLKYFM